MDPDPATPVWAPPPTTLAAAKDRRPLSRARLIPWEEPGPVPSQADPHLRCLDIVPSN